MRINHADLLTARAISPAELRELLPECGFLFSVQDEQRDPGCRPSLSQWEELASPYWLEPPEQDSEPLL